MLTQDTKSPLSPARRRAAGYFAALVAMGLVMSSLGTTLPALADNTGSGLDQISFLFTARSLGHLSASLLLARLYDRVPGHTLMAAALLLLIVGLVVTPLLNLLWLLTLVMALIGVTLSLTDLGSNTLLVWQYGRDVGPYMNALHFFFGVGAFLSPLIIAQTMRLDNGVNWSYWALALLILPIALLMVYLPSPTPKTNSEDGDVDQVRSVIVTLVAVFLMLYVAAEASLNGWLYTYALRQGISGETGAAYLTSAFWGALTVGRLLSVPIATRWPPRRLLIVTLGGALCSVLIMILWPASVLAIWGGAIGMGFFMAPVFPTTLAWAERRTRITGQVTGIFFVGASAGAMSLPWVIGQLVEGAGATVLLYGVGLDWLLAILVFAVMIVRARRLETRQWQT